MGEEKLYIIGYGLSGGFGGINDYEVILTDSIKDAEMQSYEKARDMYDESSGMYGLRTEREIMEEDGCDEEEARFTYEEERNDWIEYIAIPFTKEAENKFKDYNYSNPYKNLTDNL